ncbi:MAG TPA: single-stranded DNA-binding protein [Gammaproteobacteria bacterium]|nr:single-stranded DNA-binding protein [Gammaproteobacteria bacterium]
MSKIEGIGNLGGEPTLKYVGDDKKPVTSFRIYLSSSRMDADGNRIDRGDWYGVSVWGVCAEPVAKLLHKGDCVFVQGVLGTDRWTDKESGEDRSAPKIDASLVLPYLPFVDTLAFQARRGETESSPDADAAGAAA